MKKPNFGIRFLIIFVPLVIFIILMDLAGITKNIPMTIILALVFVWFVQAIYKQVLMRKANKEEDEES